MTANPEIPRKSVNLNRIERSIWNGLDGHFEADQPVKLKWIHRSIWTGSGGHFEPDRPSCKANLSGSNASVHFWIQSDIVDLAILIPERFRIFSIRSKGRWSTYLEIRICERRLSPALPLGIIRLGREAIVTPFSGSGRHAYLRRTDCKSEWYGIVRKVRGL